MTEGKEIHKEIADHINTYNSFPSYLDFKHKLLLPKTEYEITIPYNEICDIKGVIDCLDEPHLYEFKTGVSDSLEWARGGQIPLYFLICELAKVDTKIAYLIRYNQYLKSSDYTIIHNSQKLRDKARNIVDSVCYEIYNYFDEQGLI
jgi:hypothetical protein